MKELPEIQYNGKPLGKIVGFEEHIEEGLSIAHVGTIVINGGACIGKNLRIHVCTNIGTKAGTSVLAPIIGDEKFT